MKKCQLLGLETSRAEPGSARLGAARWVDEPSLARLGPLASSFSRLGSARRRLASQLEPAREPGHSSCRRPATGQHARRRAAELQRRMAGRSGGGEGGGGRTHPRLRPCSAHAASAMAVERMGSRKERRVRAEREGGGGGPALTRQGSEGEKGGGRRRGPVAVGFARAGEEKTAAGRRRRRRPRIEDGRLWGRRPPTPAAVLPTPPSPTAPHAAAMSTAARRTPRAASFTGEAPPLEGRGGGRRARLMAGGAVAGSGLAAAGPEGRRPGVGARAAAGGDRHSGVRQGGSRQGTAGWWRRRRGASCLLASWLLAL